MDKILLVEDPIKALQACNPKSPVKMRIPDTPCYRSHADDNDGSYYGMNEDEDIMLSDLETLVILEKA